jgi:hypothetical protein
MNTRHGRYRSKDITGRTACRPPIDLNSRIGADILLAESSDRLYAAGRNGIGDLKEDFSIASDLQTQELDSGDLTKLKEVYPMYEDILRQIETLNN